jgi:hypothetical protein
MGAALMRGLVASGGKKLGRQPAHAPAPAHATPPADAVAAAAAVPEKEEGVEAPLPVYETPLVRAAAPVHAAAPAASNDGDNGDYGGDDVNAEVDDARADGAEILSYAEAASADMSTAAAVPALPLAAAESARSTVHPHSPPPPPQQQQQQQSPRKLESMVASAVASARREDQSALRSLAARLALLEDKLLSSKAEASISAQRAAEVPALERQLREASRRAEAAEAMVQRLSADLRLERARSRNAASAAVSGNHAGSRQPQQLQQPSYGAGGDGPALMPVTTSAAAAASAGGVSRLRAPSGAGLAAAARGGSISAAGPSSTAVAGLGVAGSNGGYRGSAAAPPVLPAIGRGAKAGAGVSMAVGANANANANAFGGGRKRFM